jgi:hypothetical protein
MLKVITVSAVTLLTSAKFNLFRKVAEPEAVAAWPELDLFTTFKTDFSGFEWDGKKLTAYKDLTGTAKVDGDRNKIKVDAKVKVPLIGHASAEILVDLENQHILEYVPLLHICQKQAIPDKVSLKDILQ